MRRPYVAQVLRVLVGGLFLVSPLTGQLPEAQFQRATGIDSWPDEELAILKKGSPVVRTLPTAQKQEVVTLGILLIKDLPHISIEAFRDSFDTKHSGELESGGKFSQPPNIEDLRGLDLDDKTVTQLRKCEVGNCDLNLSAEMIRRIRDEIDSTKGNPRKHSTDIFRTMLLDHVRRYADGGDAVLGTYDNRPKKFDLSGAHRSLLSQVTIIDELAPEFLEYLRQYPHGKLKNVDNSMRWSIIDFGLKPTITISHTASYTQVTNDAIQLFIASKQIYSSRYLDASLTITTLLRVSTNNGVNSYLVFLDRSRSDVLEGPVGRFARGAVERESAERVTSIMNRAHIRLLAVTQPSKPEASVESWVDSLFRSVCGHETLLVLGIFTLFYFLLGKNGHSRLPRTVNKVTIHHPPNR